MRVLLGSGVSPLKKKVAAQAANADVEAKRITFKGFAIEYVEAKRREWRNQKHGDQWVFTLTEYAFPVIGDMPLDEIDTEHVLKILQPIWKDKTETASRLRGRIERILPAATTIRLPSGSNPALWRGHLDALLAQPRKVTRVKHHTALPFAQIPEFIRVLQDREAVAALALEFTILTTARTGEVLELGAMLYFGLNAGTIPSPNWSAMISGLP